MRERVVAAASALTLEAGWAGLTMGKLADRVGVSRQTVYNEVGSKPQLAEEMVLAELAKFLAVVDAAFDERHLDAAIDMVVRLVLSHVVHPVGDAADTADDIAWISGRTLRP
jgi:AcrR family transcriptional regulator